MGRRKNDGRIHPLAEIGDRYGRWTIISNPFQGTRRQLHYMARCDCGTVRDMEFSALYSGKSQSCGCRKAELGRGRIKHGEARDDATTRLYHEWNSMRNRCRHPSCQNYYLYGGRGIVVCDEWSDFRAFRDWARANGYQDDLVIDRIDVNGNYEPNNCRWVTIKENARNKRNNKMLTAFGETKCMIEWTEDSRCRVGYSVLQQRLRLGWDVQRALTTNVHPCHKREIKYE